MKLFKSTLAALRLLGTVAVLVALVTVFSSVAHAQTQVTPDDLQGWQRVAGTNSNAIINGEQPFSDVGDNGSLNLYTSGVGSNKGTYQLSFGTANYQNLSDLTNASFDWFRSSASTSGGHFAPVFNLMVRVGSTNYLLEWESVYNGGGYSLPEDEWVHSDIAGGNFWAWKSSGSTGWLNTSCGLKTGSQAFWTLDQWNSSCLAGAKVTGIQVSVGSGWGGSFDGYVDNVKFAFASGFEGDFDFQTEVYVPAETVPEPATMTLLATGLAGMAAARKRKQK